MSLQIGIVMDPIATIKPVRDTSLAMMRAAQTRGATLFYMGLDDLFVEGGAVFARSTPLKMLDGLDPWCEAGEPEIRPLTQFSMIWMRKDPPVDKRFLHACTMLEQAARQGVRVSNNPTSLITLNEKLFATNLFPELCPPTLVTSSLEVLHRFAGQHGRIVIKPLDAMGGSGIFKLEQDDVNFDVVWETHTQMGTYPVMAQAFLPQISEGDVRIIMLHGEAFPHVLVRRPKAGSIRSNIAAGGSGTVRPINEAEKKLCATLGPALKERGIALAGLDVIGGKLTEINITSPTGLVLIAQGCGIDVSAQLVDEMIERL